LTVRLIVIVGPTATGKTRLGVEVAHELGSEILSADSRQVYRGLNLGTGKDLGEYSAVTPPVPYHLIDIVEPDDVYTLFRYQQDCYGALRQLAGTERVGSGRVPAVMVGGSGLYVEAVLRAYAIPDVPEHAKLRQRLAAEPRDRLVERLNECLVERHGERAPEVLARTDTSSRKRLIRALEIAEAGDERELAYSPPPGLELEAAVFGVRLARELLYHRIERRVAERLEQGMVAEVADLLRRGIPRQRLESLGLEYRIISEHLCGGTPHGRMVDELKLRIRRFAKRQLTYLRGMERRGVPIHWIGPEDGRVVLRSWAAVCRPVPMGDRSADGPSV